MHKVIGGFDVQVVLIAVTYFSEKIQRAMFYLQFEKILYMKIVVIKIPLKLILNSQTRTKFSARS